MTQDDWATGVTAGIIDEVKRQRELRGWSARQLSEECKRLGYEISRSTISDLENHRRMHFGVPELLVLARALGVSPLRLIFRPGTEAETEVLPGETRSSFRAAEWFAGLGPYPEPGEDGVVTIDEVYDVTEAGDLALYRQNDRCYENERRELHRAAAMAATAASEPVHGAAYMAAAEAHRSRAEDLRAQRGALRELAEAADRIAPPEDMSLREPGDALIV